MSFIGRHKVLTGFGVLLAALVVLAAVFQWDWLIPYVDRYASSTLGRPVTIGHLHVHLGRTIRVEADDLVIGNPPDWPGGGNFATADRLGVDVLAWPFIQHRQLVIPVIDVAHPDVDAQQLPDGRANWTMGSGSSSSGSSSGGSSPEIGTLRISDGHAHVRDAKVRADFNVALQTQDSKDGAGEIAADAKGTYAAQPITAKFVGGALLSLRDAGTPYPVNLQVANGPTRVSLVGTIQHPLAFAGADLKLEFSGPDMSLLLPLTGVAIPKTPPYRVAGKLDYGDGVFTFDDFSGRVGSSDLAGNIKVDTKPQRPVLSTVLESKLVDLKDLGGFIGAQPGDAAKGTKPATPARTSGVLPRDPISLPRLNVADVYLRYHAARIEGRNQPLDNMNVNLSIVNGNVTLNPISFSIGKGTMSAEIVLSEVSNELRAHANVDFRQLDVDKLLRSAGVGGGAGTISGSAKIDGTGSSLAQILAYGDGQAKLFMGPGGDLSALLVDVSGLELGNAVLSALGVPSRTTIECLIAVIDLRRGIVTTNPVLLDTREAKIGVGGTVNLQNETMNLVVKTEAKHFSIGSLPTPIDIAGTLGAPTVRPEIGPLALRGGAAVALGIIGTPLAALIPTIQFGTGEDNACAGLLPRAEAAAQAPAAAAHSREVAREPSRRR